MYTSEQYKVHFQSIREVHVRIEILNSSDHVIDRIEGLAKDGNVSLDATSPIRRTCDIQLILQPNLAPSPTSQIWLNRRFRLWIGIRNLISGDIVYFNYGIFVINNPSLDVSVADRTISIKGLDKASLLTGDIAGVLDTNISIPVGSPIHTAIRATAQLGGETKFLIDSSAHTVPYTVEKNAGESLWDVIDELTSLYMDYQCYYDENGFLNFNAVRTKPTDAIIWNFDDGDFRTSSSSEIPFTNIKNHFKIYGRVLENGSQVKAEREIRDNNSSSPFTIEKIGRRSLVETEGKYFTNEQCTQRVNYEVWKHTSFNERVSINCLPIYLLDVNKLIYMNAPQDGIGGKYVVDKISLPLRYDGLMQISAYKSY